MPVGLVVIVYTGVYLFARCSIEHFPFLILSFLLFVVGNCGSGTEGGPVKQTEMFLRVSEPPAPLQPCGE